MRFYVFCYWNKVAVKLDERHGIILVISKATEYAYFQT